MAARRMKYFSAVLVLALILAAAWWFLRPWPEVLPERGRMPEVISLYRFDPWTDQSWQKTVSDPQGVLEIMDLLGRAELTSRQARDNDLGGGSPVTVLLTYPDGEQVTLHVHALGLETAMVGRGDGKTLYSARWPGVADLWYLVDMPAVQIPPEEWPQA